MFIAESFYTKRECRSSFILDYCVDPKEIHRGLQDSSKFRCIGLQCLTAKEGHRCPIETCCWQPVKRYDSLTAAVAIQGWVVHLAVLMVRGVCTQGWMHKICFPGIHPLGAYWPKRSATAGFTLVLCGLCAALLYLVLHVVLGVLPSTSIGPCVFMKAHQNPACCIFGALSWNIRSVGGRWEHR